MAVLRFLLLLTFIAHIVREGEALKCWCCNSNRAEQRGCADPFGGSTDISDDVNIFSRDCDQSKFYLELLPAAHPTHIYSSMTPMNDSRLVFVCYKLTGTTLGFPVVIRGCAMGMPNVTKRSCMYMNPQYRVGGNILTCDACSGDLCNGAAGVGASAVLFVGTLFLLSA